MVAVFLDDDKTNEEGDGKENGKINMFILTNNNLHVNTLFFFAVVAPLRHETS